MLHWGLIPFWANESKIGFSTINAKAETVASKPSFQYAFRQRRCLIAADGFYEWKQLDGGKQPYYIRLKNNAPFVFVGLWEHWEGGGEIIDSCAIIVIQANDVVGAIHDRMPVILGRMDYALWMNPGVEDVRLLQPILRPFPAEWMTAYPVSARVNDPKNDDRSLLTVI